MLLVSIGIIKVGDRIKSFARSIDQSSLHPIRRLRLLICSRDAYSRSPICLIVLSHQPPNTAEKVDSVVCQDPPVRLLPGTSPLGEEAIALRLAALCKVAIEPLAPSSSWMCGPQSKLDIRGCRLQGLLGQISSPVGSYRK